MSEPATIAGVEMTEDGGLSLALDEAGTIRRLSLAAGDVPLLARLLAEAMAARGAGLELDARDVLMKPPSGPGDLPRLAFLAPGWPPIAMALDWKVLHGLGLAADAALQAAPPGAAQ
ncbi:hypothetical protein [Caulobacter sp. 17J80-11]|uniref:hypothetical protein n=1 Tax=Caulobacter sp. 17J80-11 TaxID=2763502 RepID=UPI0016536F66|nr:hypothetical protein [Caulobacter sp. 17J80-11]MBC6980902.1 hypothetical protein [Caulobacter sp. 17J80-11]